MSYGLGRSPLLPLASTVASIWSAIWFFLSVFWRRSGGSFFVYLYVYQFRFL